MKTKYIKDIHDLIIGLEAVSNRIENKSPELMSQVEEFKSRGYEIINGATDNIIISNFEALKTDWYEIIIPLFERINHKPEGMEY